jgi:hypothetical protein
MISGTQIQELIENDGYPAMFETYERETPLYPQVAEVVSVGDAGAPLYGDKGSVFQNVDRFMPIEDGADPEDSTLDKGWTWQCAIKRYSRRIRIPATLLAANRLSEARDSIVTAAREWGELAIIQKDDHLAGLFQKGTLTAGSTEYFDNSYLQNADPNAGFIYDGLPWFDGAHTIGGGSSTYSNISTSLALTEANLETVLTTMRHTNAVDDRGDRVVIRPTHLVVPPSLIFTANKILNSVLLPGSANNDVNPLQGALIPVSWRALTDAASSSAFWVIQAGRGLRCYDSGAPTLRQYQHMNGDISIIAEYQFGATVTNWRYHYAANKSDS